MCLFSVNTLSKQKSTIYRGMSKSRALKVSQYGAQLTKLIDYFDVFMGLNADNKIGKIELNKTILHIMLNIWVSQDFPKFFDSEVAPLKKEINAF